MQDEHKPLIGIVGPCKSGKTTLVDGLGPLGYNVKQIAQEHSFVPQMWELISKPDFLIFLEVSYENSVKRSQLNWKPKDHQEQIRRLTHAQQNADLIIDTNQLNIEEVRTEAITFIDHI